MSSEQRFSALDRGDILANAERMHSEGYRLVQICGITKDDHTELLYSFDLDHELENFKVDVPFGEPVSSITPEYWAAFVYENEIHDLFDVEFTDSKLDYKGNFFRISAKSPWKGEVRKGEVE